MHFTKLPFCIILNLKFIEWIFFSGNVYMYEKWQGRRRRRRWTAREKEKISTILLSYFFLQGRIKMTVLKNRICCYCIHLLFFFFSFLHCFILLCQFIFQKPYNKMCWNICRFVLTIFKWNNLKMGYVVCVCFLFFSVVQFALIQCFGFLPIFYQFIWCFVDVQNFILPFSIFSYARTTISHSSLLISIHNTYTIHWCIGKCARAIQYFSTFTFEFSPSA